MTYSAPGRAVPGPAGQSGPASSGAPGTQSAAPATRLYYADPLGPGGLAAQAARAAALGFDAVVVPPPFRPGPLGDRFLLSGLGDADPLLLPQLGGDPPVAAVVSMCRSAGVGCFLDVVLDRVAAGSPLAGGSPFEAGDTLDPRRPALLGAAAARDAGPDDAEALARWWSQQILPWQASGLTGVRLLGLDHLRHPDLVLRALRSHLPGLQLLAWLPGVPRPLALNLRGAGIDLVAASLPWWDWRSTWFWDELDALRSVGRVVLPTGVPLEQPGGGTFGGTSAWDRRLAAAALAAILGDAWMLVGGGPEDRALADRVVELNRLATALPTPRRSVSLAAPGADALAVLLPDAPGVRSGAGASLLLLNASAQPVSVRAETVLPQVPGAYGTFRQGDDRTGAAFRPGSAFALPPGGYSLLRAEAVAEAVGQPADRSSAGAAARVPRVAVEDPSPCVDAGAFPAKRIMGELLSVEADILSDGHDKLAAVLLWRGPGGTDAEWREVRMAPLGNDRWTASFPLSALGSHEYDVAAWRDAYASFRDELHKKRQAGVPVALELQEGASIVRASASRVSGSLRAELDGLLAELAAASPEEQGDLLLSSRAAEIMWRADDRPHLARLPHPIPVECERPGASFSSWYEVFPRSLSDDPTRHGTLRDVERHLPRIAAMGFDVLYFPPIHPIGLKNRKGRNNSLKAEPDDPGSPYAIGSEAGGHDALHPELGTMDDFRHLVRAAAEHGLELALDFAIQCSPDHPWLKEHTDWFQWRPDGSIRYAENPPKKYEDIVNVDFYALGAVPGLWVALCDAVLFWAKEGVRLFRVDNPHTKPFPFWHWMIATVRKQYPDTVFLAEAFTRPKVMYRLAKVGFGQSYTYFTWRTKRWEFEQYMTELTQAAPRNFFRPHFFVNTPDINPPYLQGAPREAYMTRAALAATLSGLWGVYNGFELCEGTPVPGKEEYLDSEKYQLRAWDWERPGNIVPEITQLNAIRKHNPALHSHLNLRFLECPDEDVLWYEKALPDRSNVLLIAINMQPGTARDVVAALPFWHWGRDENTAFDAEDLLGGGRATWRGKWQRFTLGAHRPYAVWRVSPAG